MAQKLRYRTERFRGSPSKQPKAYRGARSLGPIFEGAPDFILDQGRLITLAPQLPYVSNNPISGGTGGWAYFPPGHGVRVAITGGTGSVFKANTDGYAIDMTTDSTNGDEIVAIFNGGPTATNGVELFTPAAGRTIRYAMRMQVSDISDIDFFVGLAEEDNTPVGSNNRICFEWDTTATPDEVRLDVSSGGSSITITPEDGAAAIPDGSYFDFGFVVNGLDSVHFYLNGKEYTQRTTANIPTVAMAPHWWLQTRTGASSKTMSVRRFIVTQEDVV